jgi:hypothetical protein
MAGSKVGADLWVSEYVTPWDIYVHGVTKVWLTKKLPTRKCTSLKLVLMAKGWFWMGSGNPVLAMSFSTTKLSYTQQ